MKYRGFTLVEMLLIIGIIGILALIGIPAFKTYQPSFQLSGTARQLATDLRYAGQLAVTEQIEYGIKFFIDTNEYQIIRHGTTDETIKSEEFPQEVMFYQVTGFTNNEAIFNPYGAARETGDVILINTKNSTTSISVRPSGFVKVIK